MPISPKNKGTNPKSKRYLRRQRRARRARQGWALSGLVVAAGLLLAGYILWPRAASAAVPPDRLQDNPTRGASDALVTIVEFGDFGCPACQPWHAAGVIDQILAAYGDQVRFVWRDLPVITAQSPKAAEAAQCAYDQGDFWAYHDLLFERAPHLSVRDLKAYAGELGLDQASFDQCLDADTHRETVQVDREEALRMGLRGTPSFTVNGQPLIGPNPNYMIQLIEQQLAGS